MKGFYKKVWWVAGDALGLYYLLTAFAIPAVTVEWLSVRWDWNALVSWVVACVVGIVNVLCTIWATLLMYSNQGVITNPTPWQLIKRHAPAVAAPLFAIPMMIALIIADPRRAKLR